MDVAVAVLNPKICMLLSAEEPDIQGKAKLKVLITMCGENGLL